MVEHRHPSNLVRLGLGGASGQRQYRGDLLGAGCTTATFRYASAANRYPRAADGHTDPDTAANGYRAATPASTAHRDAAPDSDTNAMPPSTMYPPQVRVQNHLSPIVKTSNVVGGVVPETGPALLSASPAA
jgi:hypothetical protein